MGSSTVSDGAIVSNTDSLDPRRSDPCVVSSPITVTSATVNQRLGINRGNAKLPQQGEPLHDSQATGRSVSLPERLSRRSLRRLWVDGHLTHYDSDVEPHAEVDRFAIRDVNIPTEESTTGCPVSLMEAA